MPDINLHLDFDKKFFGEEFYSVHKFLDTKAAFTDQTMKPNHRIFCHNFDILPLIEEKFGKKGKLAAVGHMCLDIARGNTAFVIRNFHFLIEYIRFPEYRINGLKFLVSYFDYLKTQSENFRKETENLLTKYLNKLEENAKGKEKEIFKNKLKYFFGLKKVHLWYKSNNEILNFIDKIIDFIFCITLIGNEKNSDSEIDYYKYNMAIEIIDQHMILKEKVHFVDDLWSDIMDEFEKIFEYFIYGEKGGALKLKVYMLERENNDLKRRLNIIKQYLPILLKKDKNNENKENEEKMRYEKTKQCQFCGKSLSSQGHRMHEESCENNPDNMERYIKSNEKNTFKQEKLKI